MGVLVLILSKPFGECSGHSWVDFMLVISQTSNGINI